MYPAVGMADDGSTVIAWLQTRAPRRVLVQRFDPQGIPVAGEFVSSGRLRGDFPYGLVMQGSAGFLTLWASGLEDYARLHLPPGVPVGDPVLINRQPCSVEACFDILEGLGVTSGGGFVGVWYRQTEDERFFFARWFDRDATFAKEIPLSDEHLVAGNDSPFGVAAGPEQTVTFGWTSVKDNYAETLHVQTYSASGEKIGNGFVQDVPGLPIYASLTWNPLTLNLVVAWTAEESFPGGCCKSKVYMQRLLPDGRALGQQPLLLSEPGWGPVNIACNVKGYCVIGWWAGSATTGVGIVTRVMRPDGTLTSAVLVGPEGENVDFSFETFAYGGNGALTIAGTDFHCLDDYCGSYRANVAVRRLIASPGDEVCQRVGNEVRCDSGRTGSLPELRLARFGLDRRDTLLFGDVDGDGRAEPCRVRNGLWRCDTDHEGGTTETVLGFTGAASGTPLLGDLDGDGRADACSWSAGILRCDTAHNGGAPELSIPYGRSRETPLLGDLDGDGRDDLCMASRGSLRCDVDHNGGRTETQLSFGQPGDLFVLGDFDGNGTDDPCLVRAGKLLCDTAHDGGEPEAELLLGTPGSPVLLGNLDGV